MNRTYVGDVIEHLAVISAQHAASSSTWTPSRVISRRQDARNPVRGIVTATTVMLAGDFDGTAFSGGFAYTRLWRQAGDRWRVAAGHASQVSQA
ncbi:hypothetical protein [Burkholderia vietnamiensis]|uniref:hypothetical protein n=1 Tax=Burkholderia vietnamiensis TaxID=60552 RepID=UPI003D15F40A